ncbi:hypothetical protein BZJ17_12305 [Salinivibrio sp. IB574]|uniref:DUF805 domain-containing protein n=1 Tax=Salinivibrio sp. IB574 TaxID=1909444 RepID=UPI000988D83C|nr:DUF805 domain-containing protein [Salinivibrio sp. IB574]OOF20680.1 hypothetical protein BZJ17_12305 [Salinivibrio sp. IB574]
MKQSLSFYFGLSGTVSQRQFWLCFVLPWFVIQSLMGIAVQHDSIQLMDGIWTPPEVVFSVLGFFIQLFVTWATVALSIKRLRELGYPARTLLAMIPGLGTLWVWFELLFSAPDNGHPL